MRKKIMLALCGLTSPVLFAQDTLNTTTILKEVVVTGTKYEVSVEKSGKTITKITAEDLAHSAGKSLGDFLNEVPGIQTDGNFGTPGSNISYYVRGGRNKNTLVLIDGVPLNDPSAIHADYDLRYIPVSQIESIEVLKGGHSTLYGTGAAAGVINIKLKEPLPGKINGSVDMNAASFKTFSQSVQVSGTQNKFSYLVYGNNAMSEGFSSAEDRDETVDFDKDGFSRQNGLIKAGLKVSEQFNISFHTAYEQFRADYDAYEFTDANNTQKYYQYRVGLAPTYRYKHGEVAAKIFHNVNNRIFESDFPSDFQGRNLQAEFTQRHHLSDRLQSLIGINYQRMAFSEKNSVGIDSTHFAMFDPYASLLLDIPAGLTVHTGIRLNTHSTYGNKIVYNLNPSFLINRKGIWKYKILASVSTSYITPTLYQLYSPYGNQDLDPEEARNYEAGFSILRGEKLTFSATLFHRDEIQPIDFVSIFDDEGNYVRGQYQNLVSERMVKGVELSLAYRVATWLRMEGQFSRMDTDVPVSFYKIPKQKFGGAVIIDPSSFLSVSLKYNYTGDRTTYDFTTFSELTLASYDLVDLFASYKLLDDRLTIYGSVNNFFDERFTAVHGYTTIGRNYSLGLRYTLR